MRRLYTEKRAGSGGQAMQGSLLSDITDFLGIRTASGIRELIRYDVQGLTDQEFLACKAMVFSEPPVDVVYEDDFPRDSSDFVLAVKYLPGQYDQRADSAAFCAAVLRGASDGGEDILVESARVYVISGELSEEDKASIKRHLINPVDEEEASFDLPQRLSLNLPEPPPVRIIGGFIHASDSDLRSIYQEKGLAMSFDDLLVLRDYFRDEEHRDPTETELRAVDTYWSDHCRHTTFLTHITDVQFTDGPYKAVMERAYSLYLEERGDSAKPITLMDLALAGMKAIKKRGLLTDLEESEEINAAGFSVNAIENGEEAEWLVMFKNETHNHPTEIEPFGGAATCLGGAIRDPLSGRSYVYQAMRVTGSADPRAPLSATLPGRLPQRRITLKAAEGFSSYGNQIGLATGLVAEVYHPGYAAKRMEIGAVIGAARRSHVIRNSPDPGDLVILVGGRTGRDGIGGATGSSKEHTGQSTLICGAEVQKGNAPTERKLQRLFRNPEASRLIKKCNDFGAGGVAVAVGELADGIDIDLDKVIKKYEGLDGTELAISESQERMAVVTAKEDAPAFIKLAQEENLEAVVLARVTDDARLVMRWRGERILDIARSFLDKNGAARSVGAVVRSPEPLNNERTDSSGKSDIKDRWLNNLSRLNVCCQKGLTERFDSVVGAGTVLMPHGGRRQLTPVQAMAAKLPAMGGDIDICTLMAYGFNPELSARSPFHGAVAAVVESVAKVLAAGGRLERIRLSFQEYFGKPGEDPERFGTVFSALLGAFQAQMSLNTPSIGGKDSMSGTFTAPDGRQMDVPPTLVSFAVAAEPHKNVISPEFKGTGNPIALLRCGVDADGLPDFAKFKRNSAILRHGIENGAVISAWAIGPGGAAAGIEKMSLGNEFGADINVGMDLLAEDYGGFVLELASELEGADIIGHTTSNDYISVNGVSISLNEALESWAAPLSLVFPIPKGQNEDVPAVMYNKRKHTPCSPFAIKKP
ncbi:MAG: phosphoribosylformylglycinamidine synthase, partial [Clostridiales bacterium]|nr:phosphoribosylformylglycinamidine synthase [Clostridiales bacterium]